MNYCHFKALVARVNEGSLFRHIMFRCSACAVFIVIFLATASAVSAGYTSTDGQNQTGQDAAGVDQTDNNSNTTSDDVGKTGSESNCC